MPAPSIDFSSPAVLRRGARCTITAVDTAAAGAGAGTGANATAADFYDDGAGAACARAYLAQAAGGDAGRTEVVTGVVASSVHTQVKVKNECFYVFTVSNSFGLL